MLTFSSLFRLAKIALTVTHGTTYDMGTTHGAAQHGPMPNAQAHTHTYMLSFIQVHQLLRPCKRAKAAHKSTYIAAWARACKPAACAGQRSGTGLQ
jgi:hypothetical protein